MKGRVFEFWVEFSQGRQDKHPAGHPGMWNYQERVVNNEIIIEQKIKIQRTVLMAGRIGVTLAAEFPFNTQKQGQQFHGRQTGLQLAHGVDKPVF